MNFVGIMARNVGLTERDVLPVALEEQPRQRRTIISDIALPGFRFHPTEEELVGYYLKRMVQGKRNSVELIALLDLYQYDPWELPALAFMGEWEWFFYCPRDKKYPNGVRPNRVTTSGYWKATGTDRAVRSTTADHRCIGLKKTLVFYTGRAPRGIKTDWIMNEYRIPVDGSNPPMSGSTSISDAICSITMTQSGYQRFFTKNDVALCRIYRKSSSISSAGIHHLELKPREGVAGSSSSHEHLISSAENALQNSSQKVISNYNYNYSQQQLLDSPAQMLQGPSNTSAAAAATLSSSSVFHDQLHPETASCLLSSHAVMARLLEENCCYDGCGSQPIMSIDSRISSTHGGTINMQQQNDTDMGVSNAEGSVPRGSKTNMNTSDSDSSKVDGSFEREGPFIDMFRQLRWVQHLDAGPPRDSLRSTVAGQPATGMNDVRILKGCCLTTSPYHISARGTTEELPKLAEQRAVQSCSQMQRIYHNNNSNSNMEFHPRLQLPTIAEYWGDGDRCTPSASKSQETSSSARLELDALSSLTFT